MKLKHETSIDAKFKVPKMLRSRPQNNGGGRADLSDICGPSSSSFDVNRFDTDRHNRNNGPKSTDQVLQQALGLNQDNAKVADTALNKLSGGDFLGAVFAVGAAAAGSGGDRKDENNDNSDSNSTVKSAAPSPGSALVENVKRYAMWVVLLLVLYFFLTYSGGGSRSRSSIARPPSSSRF